jgi:hypothetical protein
VILYMIGTYGVFGLIASIALLVHVCLIFGLMSVLGATMTLPGIAAVALALPADPALSGLVVYEQFAALAPNANALGLALSNGVAVTLGSFAPAGRGTWLVSHDTSATAAYATAVRAFGMALRLRTL